MKLKSIAYNMTINTNLVLLVNFVNSLVCRGCEQEFSWTCWIGLYGRAVLSEQDHWKMSDAFDRGSSAWAWHHCSGRQTLSDGSDWFIEEEKEGSRTQCFQVVWSYTSSWNSVQRRLWRMLCGVLLSMLFGQDFLACHRTRCILQARTTLWTVDGSSNRVHGLSILQGSGVEGNSQMPVLLYCVRAGDVRWWPWLQCRAERGWASQPRCIPSSCAASPRGSTSGTDHQKCLEQSPIGCRRLGFSVMSFFIFEWTLHFFHLSSLRQLRLAGLCLQKKFCFYILKHYVYLLVDVLLLG